MIYSIGYSGLHQVDLVRIVRAMDPAILIDVRTKPHGRCKEGFFRSQLEQALGQRYEWHGDTLGGLGDGPTKTGLCLLVARARNADLLLMCKEECPGECHRHHLIAMPLWRDYGINVHHIYQDQLIAAHELQRSIDDDDDYTYSDIYRDNVRITTLG